MATTPAEQTCPHAESLLEMIAASPESEEQRRLHAHIRACERCYAAVRAMASSDQPAPAAAEHVIPPGLTIGTKAPGMILGGRFELIHQLGSGGFGDVYLARDLRNARREVALKMLKEKHQANPLVVYRFEQECASLEWLTHPNIVRVFERGQWQGGRYIVMEYIEGQSLESWLGSHRQHGTLPNENEVFAIFFQICEAMVFAHNLDKAGGIIHRDLKPANIMLTMRGPSWHVTLLDFGLARIGERQGTWTAEAIGTPAYMAPEQIDNQAEVGPWTDVYAMGIILIEMLTLLKRDDRSRSYWHAALNNEKGLVRQLQARRPNIAAAVFEAVVPALRPHAAQRYQTSFELLNAVRRAASRRRPIHLAKDIRTAARYAILLLFVFLDGSPRRQQQQSLAWLTRWFARNITHSSFSLDLDVYHGSTSSTMKIEGIPPETTYIRVRIMRSDVPNESNSLVHICIYPKEMIPSLYINRSRYGHSRLEVVAFNEKFGIGEYSETIYDKAPETIQLKSCKNGLCEDNVGSTIVNLLGGDSYNAIAGDEDVAYIAGKNVSIQSYSSSMRLPLLKNTAQKHYIISFFGSDMNNLYAVGGCRPSKPCPYPQRRAVLLHLDPVKAEWTEELAPPGAAWLWWGWQAPSREIWVVGGRQDGRNIAARRSFSSGRWEEIPVQDEQISLRDVWGSGNNDVWTLGWKPKGGTRLLRYLVDRKEFELQSGIPIDEDLWSIWGTSQADIWVGGERGTLIHYDGASWSKAPCNPAPTQSAIYNLAGRAWNDIWATGDRGYIAHYDGTCWQNFSTLKFAIANPKQPTAISGLWVRGSDAWILSGSGDRMHFRYADPRFVLPGQAR